MTDDKSKNSQKITPANSGDELDVLESLYLLGKERGKEFLLPEHLEKLKNSGRLKGEFKREDLNNKVIVSGKDLIAYTIEEALVESLIKHKIYTKEQWEKKNFQVKNSLLEAYSYVVLGVDLNDWKMKIGGNK